MWAEVKSTAQELYLTYGAGTVDLKGSLLRMHEQERDLNTLAKDGDTEEGLY